MIPYDQKYLSKEISQNKKEYKYLYKIINKYNGTCELICNYILRNNIFDKIKGLEKVLNYIIHPNSLVKTKELNDSLTVSNLNESPAKKMHVLENTSLITLAFYHITSYYPGNMLKTADQKKLQKKKSNCGFNKELIDKVLNKMQDGQYVKVLGLSDDSHSMLIHRKASDSFLFFDPNEGMVKLNQFETKEKISNLKYDRIIFIDGNKFLDDYCIKNLNKYKIIKFSTLITTLTAGTGLYLALYHNQLTNIWLGVLVASAVMTISLIIFGLFYKPKFDPGGSNTSIPKTSHCEPSNSFYKPEQESNMRFYYEECLTLTPEIDP